MIHWRTKQTSLLTHVPSLRTAQRSLELHKEVEPLPPSIEATLHQELCTFLSPRTVSDEPGPLFPQGQEQWKATSSDQLRFLFADRFAWILAGFMECIFWVDTTFPVFDQPRFLSEHTLEHDVPAVRQLLDTQTFHHLIENLEVSTLSKRRLPRLPRLRLAGIMDPTNSLACWQLPEFELFLQLTAHYSELSASRKKTSTSHQEILDSIARTQATPSGTESWVLDMPAPPGPAWAAQQLVEAAGEPILDALPQQFLRYEHLEAAVDLWTIDMVAKSTGAPRAALYSHLNLPTEDDSEGVVSEPGFMTRGQSMVRLTSALDATPRTTNLQAEAVLTDQTSADDLTESEATLRR